MGVTQKDAMDTMELTENLLSDIENGKYKDYVALAAYLIVIRYIVAKKVIKGNGTIEDAEQFLDDTIKRMKAEIRLLLKKV